MLVGRNIEIVLERSRQGLLRLETIAFRQVQDWLIALLELLRNLRQLAAADVLAEGMAGLFLKHTLQVPLRVTGALQTLFPATGRFQVILDHDKILWIVMASLLRLDIILPLLIFTAGTFLSSCSSMATSSADRFSLTPGVTSDPQPDDTARKGLRRRVNCTSTPRLSAGLGNRSIQPLHARRSSMRVIAPGRRKARFSAQQGNTYFATNGAEPAKLGRGNIHKVR